MRNVFLLFKDLVIYYPGSPHSRSPMTTRMKGPYFQCEFFRRALNSAILRRHFSKLFCIIASWDLAVLFEQSSSVPRSSIHPSYNSILTMSLVGWFCDKCPMEFASYDEMLKVCIIDSIFVLVAFRVCVFSLTEFLSSVPQHKYLACPSLLALVS